MMNALLAFTLLFGVGGPVDDAAPERTLSLRVVHARDGLTIQSAERSARPDDRAVIVSCNSIHYSMKNGKPTFAFTNAIVKSVDGTTITARELTLDASAKTLRFMNIDKVEIKNEQAKRRFVDELQR